MPTIGRFIGICRLLPGREDSAGAQLDPGYRVRKGESTPQKGRQHMDRSERWLHKRETSRR